MTDLQLGRHVEQPLSPDEAVLDPVPNPHPGVSTPVGFRAIGAEQKAGQ